jgi:hypothetical protein
MQRPFSAVHPADALRVSSAPGFAAEPCAELGARTPPDRSSARLSELTKPQQLAGWDEVATEGLTGFLERVAKKDTEMKGLFATTRLDLKTEAWETALTAGCSRVEDWGSPRLICEFGSKTPRRWMAGQHS